MHEYACRIAEPQLRVFPPRVFNFLALHHVHGLKNGLIPTVIATIWTLDTLPSAKNLKVEDENPQSCTGTRNMRGNCTPEARGETLSRSQRLGSSA
jgi:hypothetical protein